MSSAQGLRDGTSKEPLPGAGPLVLRGTAVCGGLVVGPAHRKEEELERAAFGAAPAGGGIATAGGAAAELNRFRDALERSRRQIEDLRGQLTGKVSTNDVRVLDTHLAYLVDSAFVNDVEKHVLEGGLVLEAAVARVVSDFERIFKLVQNERLRQGAVDMRDVGIRVLRNLEAQGYSPSAPAEPYVLVARELSIVDMFHLDGQHVAGILVEEGGLAGHAAIFARSMGIPTLIGVSGALDQIAEGDPLLLDASEGLVRVRPEQSLLDQYRAGASREPSGDELELLRQWNLDALATAGGAEVRLTAACGSLPEVAQAARAGVAEIGLYRTELLFLADARVPSVDALRAHYEAVFAQALGARVTFRLLSLDSGAGAEHLVPFRDPNPRLGRAGVRLLLAQEELLRRQLKALLLAAGTRRLRVAVPFVLDGSEVARVRSILEQERELLRQRGLVPGGVPERAEVGAVVEIPGALFQLADLARAADFLAVNLDSLAAHVMAADRQVAELEHLFRHPHPAVLAAVEHGVRAAVAARAPLSAFGAALEDPDTALLLAGAGLRTFAVAPAALAALAGAFREADLGEAAAALGAQTRGGARRSAGARPARKHPGA